MTQIAVMLGGNMAGSREAMQEAVGKLSAAGVKNIAASKAMSSAAVDCVPDTPDFLDMAVTGTWGGSADELLKLCRSLEIAAGRPAVHSSRESRILDCDIILFGEQTIDTPELTIPHPRAREREFVLIPLAEIAPDRRFPDGVTVKESLQILQDRKS